MKQMPTALEYLLGRVAYACHQKRIDWDTKEEMMDDALEIFGWTRQDLRDYNEERENAANRQAN